MAQDDAINRQTAQVNPFSQAGLIPAGNIGDPSSIPTAPGSGDAPAAAGGLIPAGNISDQSIEGGATFGEMTGAAIESGGRGAATSTGFVAGAIGGAKAGAVVAPFAGPLAPAVPFVTGLVGAIGGAYAGDQLADTLGLRAPSDLPENLRPAGYFGESFFGSVPFMATPYGLNAMNYRAGDTVVGRLMNKILDTAKAKPVQFGAAETLASLQAAVFAGTAEEVAPGKPVYRIGAEIIGGATSRITQNAAKWAVNTVGNVWNSMSSSGRQTSAGELLGNLITLGKEDPSVIARVLNEQSLIIDGQEVPLTAAQITGSPSLIGLENQLRTVDPAFGAEAQRRANEALDIIRGKILLLRNTGDDTALQAAAELQGVYFRTLIEARVQTSIDEAVAAAARITTDTPAARAEINRGAREQLNNAIIEARRIETELHNLVDGTTSVEFTNLQQAYDKVVADLLPELVNEKTPDIVRNFLRRVGTPRKAGESLIILPENIGRDVIADIPGTNVAEMRQLRSELLDLGRQSINLGNFSQARIYNTLADAVLDDMDAAFAATGDTAYQTARQFSRELNETFNRSFAGKVTATGRFGERVMPEMTLTKALATGREAGAIQLQELEEATRFMVTHGYGDSSAVREMMTAQERIIRLAAADAIDLETGLVKPALVRKFLKDNALLMERFPEIRSDLQRAIDFEDAREAMVSLAKRQNRTMETAKAFTSIHKAGQVTAADRMLISRNQEQDLMAMIKVAKVGGRTIDGMQISPQKATAGLKTAVIDAAVRRATNRQTGVINIESFRSFLFEPSIPGRKAPIDILQENGVFGAEEVANMRRLFDAARNIQTAQAGVGVRVDSTEDVGDMVIGLVAKLAGSAAAGEATRAAGRGGNSIIIHGAAAKFTNDIVRKLPVKKRSQALVEMMLDPEKAALVLNRIDNPADAAIRARQINAWFIQSGIVTAKEIMEVDEPDVDPMTRPGFLRQPRQ